MVAAPIHRLMKFKGKPFAQLSREEMTAAVSSLDNRKPPTNFKSVQHFKPAEKKVLAKSFLRGA